MLTWIKQLLANLRARKAKKMHDATINEYRSFATAFGDGLSYGYLGDPEVQSGRKWLKIAECWDELDRLEVAYADLGYRILSVDDWIDHGGYGKDIERLWLVKRFPGERPVFTRDLMRK